MIDTNRDMCIHAVWALRGAREDVERLYRICHASVMTDAKVHGMLRVELDGTGPAPIGAMLHWDSLDS